MNTKRTISRGVSRGLAAAASITAIGAFLVTALASSKARAVPKRPLATVPHVDLERYLGTWYELAAYPQWFERGCTATTATYSLRDDGMIRVENRCHVDSPDGRLKRAVGRARVVDPKTNAKLQVSFFPFIWGPYWIIDLGPDYRYAVVGSPDRKSLWILSRTPTLDDDTWEQILLTVAAHGFDPSALQRTEQPGA